MNKGSGNKGSGKGAGRSREDRLKAALKANLARRKMQARARTANPGDDGVRNRNKAGD